MRRPEFHPWPDCHQLDDRPLVEELARSKWNSPLRLRGRYLQMLTSEFKTRQLVHDPETELQTFWNWLLTTQFNLRIESLIRRSQKPVSLWPLLSLAYQRFKRSDSSENPKQGWPWDDAPEIASKVQNATDVIWNEFQLARNSESKIEALIFDFYLDGLSPQEIAFLCRVPTADVAAVLEHAKNEVRETLQRKWA